MNLDLGWSRQVNLDTMYSQETSRQGLGLLGGRNRKTFGLDVCA